MSTAGSAAKKELEKEKRRRRKKKLAISTASLIAVVGDRSTNVALLRARMH